MKLRVHRRSVLGFQNGHPPAVVGKGSYRGYSIYVGGKKFSCVWENSSLSLKQTCFDQN